MEKRYTPDAWDDADIEHDRERDGDTDTALLDDDPWPEEWDQFEEDEDDECEDDL